MPAASLEQYFEAVLQDLGINPDDQNSIDALETMARGESSSGYLLSYNNPLATTRGSSTPAAQGVIPTTSDIPSYIDAGTGELLTADTFKNGLYPTLLQNLKADAPASAYESPAVASELGTWQGGGASDIAQFRTGAFTQFNPTPTDNVPTPSTTPYLQGAPPKSPNTPQLAVAPGCAFWDVPCIVGRALQGIEGFGVTIGFVLLGLVLIVVAFLMMKSDAMGGIGAQIGGGKMMANMGGEAA